MADPYFDGIAATLQTRFDVDPALAHRETTLEQLGLDSLTLMEFVFEVEDRFGVRVPQDQLDPRQAGITLGHLALLLQRAVEERGAPEAAPAAT